MWTISAGEETARSPGDVKHSNPGFLPFLMGDRDINGSARPCTEFLWNFGLAPPPSIPQSSLLPLIPPVGPLPSFLCFYRSQLGDQGALHTTLKGPTPPAFSASTFAIFSLRT